MSDPRERATEGLGPAAPRVFAPSPEGLLDQVAWFNRMRFVAVSGVLLLTSVAAHGVGAVADPRPLYALAVGTLVINLLYCAWFWRLARVPTWRVRRHVDLQIAIDLLILTAILHFSGGVTNPFVLSYLFHAFIAALLLSLRAAMVVVAASVVLISALAFSERTGWLEHHPIGGSHMDLRAGSALGLVAWLAAFAVTLMLSVYFVGRVLSRLARREKQLVRLDRQLANSEKLASVGTLAAGVAHEINNPVGVIQNKVQILRYRIDDGDPRPVLLEDLAVVEQHAQRISGIVAGLLAFSREAPFSLEPVDLNRLVRESADLVAVPFRTADVALRTRTDPELEPVAGSANHLMQVLVNLILNAKDASSPGSVVVVSTRREPSGAVLSVADRGEGIAPENLSQIFDPFFTTKDVGHGTGLGLAISHGIVERHQGRIEVQSEPEVGTTFRVWLPLADLSRG
ncbi:MAG: ATP-binding protein [Planctomycetota bacterium]